MFSYIWNKWDKLNRREDGTNLTGRNVYIPSTLPELVMNFILKI